MKVVSVVNYKGGVGKTTFIANIAAKLANEGKKILLIDLDPQGSLTFSLIHADEWQERYSGSRTIKNWFDDRLNNRSTNINDYIIGKYLIGLKLTNDKLISLGQYLGVKISKSNTKLKMINIIVDSIVGNKLKIEGLRKGILGE